MRCLDYASTAQAAFLSAGGSWAKCSLHIKILLNTFLCLSQTGSNAVYILFVAHNTQHVGVSLREYYITFYITYRIGSEKKNQMSFLDSGGSFWYSLGPQRLHLPPPPPHHHHRQHPQPQVHLALLHPRHHHGAHRQSLGLNRVYQGPGFLFIQN